jgi:hypothetical protein
MQVIEIESSLTKFNGCSFTFDQDHEWNWDLGLVNLVNSISFIFPHHHFFPLQVYIYKTFGFGGYCGPDGGHFSLLKLFYTQHFVRVNSVGGGGTRHLPSIKKF